MTYLYNGTRLMPDYPTSFTPDATTAAVVPGLTYQPYPDPRTGLPRGNFDAGPAVDGFDMRDPYGRITANYFDGSTLWNRGISPEVSKLITSSDFGITQLSQWMQWQQGQTPYPPNFQFPSAYPGFAGTPANPIGTGAEIGLAGIPPGYGGGYNGAYGGAYAQQAYGAPYGQMINPLTGPSNVVPTNRGVTSAIPGPGVQPAPIGRIG
ncbi:MAG: hypothetical protein HEQ32_00575 [Vampirovibrio sp.]